MGHNPLLRLGKGTPALHTLPLGTFSCWSRHLGGLSPPPPRTVEILRRPCYLLGVNMSLFAT